VREVIFQHYDLLKDQFIRDAYYLIRDFLAPMIGERISQEDYDWLLTKQGYSSLRDDIWSSIEQQKGLERPKAWPMGIIFWEGIGRPLSEVSETDLEITWDQARGFIFVEKGGEAEKIKVLSKYGWLIAAGKGYPERLMRKLLKQDSRPVLALHDWDRDGLGVYRALGFETRRTKHLKLALGERVMDLGLTEDDVKKLNLPTEPSPPKYKGTPRVELSGLIVLKLRMGIENPTLAYTVAKMAAKDITLSPTEVEKLDMMKRHIRWALTEGLRGIVEEAIEIIMEELKGDPKFEGTAVEGRLEDMRIIAPGLKEKLVESGLIQAEKTTWRYEEDFHQEAIEKLTDEKLIQILSTEVEDG